MLQPDSVFFSVAAMPNTGMKTAFTLWGVMGIASGFGMIAGGAGYNWLLFTGIAIASVCWVLAKRQLKKSRGFARQQHSPGE